MKSYWIRTGQGGTVLEPRDVPAPTAGAGQLVVGMRAASLNRGELLASIGLHSASEPRPAGGDLSGVVEAVGPGVSGFRTGDRVMGRARGSFSESVLMLVEQAAVIPERLSFEEAASLPTVGVTAWEILCQYGRLRSGETLLVAGATSGVGTVCVQFGKFTGARVFGTSGSAEKLAKLTTLGLDVGIHAREKFGGKVLEATGGKGVNLAVNLIGGSAFPDCLQALSNQGRMAIVGYVDRTLKSEIDLEAVHGKRLQIYGVSNAHLTAAERAVAFAGFVRDMLPAYAAGSIVPVVDRVFPFDDLPAAKAYVETDAQIGKVVVQRQ